MIETSPSLFRRVGFVSSELFLRADPIIGLLLRRILGCCSNGTTCVSEADFLRAALALPLLERGDAAVSAWAEESGTRLETPRGATSILNVMLKGTAVRDTFLKDHQRTFKNLTSDL